MKNIRFILTALLAGLFAVACEEKPIDGLSGTYDNIERYNFTEVKQQPTEKLGKGIKALVIDLKDAAGHSMQMRIGSAEWVLKAGTYAAAETVAADKTFSAVLGESRKVVSGNLNVNLVNDTYIFSGLLTAEDGTEIQCNYRGVLAFEIGVDDPEPSGYTAVLAISPVLITDQSGQVTGTVPGVSKYAFTISDPDGANAAYFEAINTENLDATALAGEYTVKDNAQDALSMASGMQMPAEWGGFSWGSFVANPTGTKEFLAAGSKITVSVAESLEGEKLYSFSGSGLKTTLTMNGDGSVTSGTLTECNIKFATLQLAGSN
ncbi:hypothetical protein [uncultured Alistipes sp.]|uniref:hypothetical protein n=1 Tax=uncultured Alistipes sp. TaxID=538949 RepID=UPI0025974BB2|nr:hypothetical protein [uncultured Alistipes sp.]